MSSVSPSTSTPHDGVHIGVYDAIGRTSSFESMCTTIPLLMMKTDLLMWARDPANQSIINERHSPTQRMRMPRDANHQHEMQCIA
mmetsp:Transcript_16721/g.46217  ORF Transcript_16721/g.46217 Transcript_16721/m.46217 type:complete len:85 (-) Transcript_16721:536-790(-)